MSDDLRLQQKTLTRDGRYIFAVPVHRRTGIFGRTEIRQISRQILFGILLQGILRKKVGEPEEDGKNRKSRNVELVSEFLNAAGYFNKFINNLQTKAPGYYFEDGPDGYYDLMPNMNAGDGSVK